MSLDEKSDLKKYPSMNVGRSGHACSMVKAKGGKKFLVVAGGESWTFVWRKNIFYSFYFSWETSLKSSRKLVSWLC
jgi:hypothetical protein